MSEIQPSHQELENQLREQVADAKVRLELARNYLKEVQRALEAGTIPPPNGQYAYQDALRAETLALKHYQRVLKTLSILIYADWQDSR